MPVNSVDINIIMNFRRLRHLQRCNNFARNSNEDVAQHSYYVSLLAMILGDELNVNDHFLDEHRDLNMEQVMRKALLHDTEEAVTSDIPHNVKNNSAEFKVKLNDVLNAISKGYYAGASESMLEYQLIGYNCKEDLEGSVVDLADMLELAIYCFEEVNTGNKYMQGLLDKALALVVNKPLYPYSETTQALVDFMVTCKTADIAVMCNL